MKVAIPTEIAANERRVAATPETVRKMTAVGLKVAVQKGAGAASSILDSDFEAAGAVIAADTAALYAGADIVLKVQKPVQNAEGKNEADLIPEGACLIGLLQPLLNPDLVKKLTARKITAFSMDMVPRIARAQRLDALSSQSNIAGYKAVLMGANQLGKIMPLLMTAAGTISPARVLVLGAGVAGLQAVATARRLGAIVEAFDTRPVVKEQVESLGGKFISLEVSADTEDKGGYAKELSKDQHERELELIGRHAENADIIITTAQIPGKRSPLLVTEAMVKKMKQGSVIVDLAAEGGGNCELTEADREVVKHGVTIIGHTNVPSLMAAQSSQLYARNIGGLLLDMIKEGKLNPKYDDEIIKGALIVRGGEVVHPALAPQTKGATA